MRNRIINGAMVIDQRNAGASVTPASGNYTLDRWFFGLDQASKLTAQQNAGAVTPPTGFTNYLGVTSTSAYTVGASESFTVRQNLEGFNVADLGWGTANAKTVTLSFWVRSSLTGTFGGTLSNGDQNRCYVFSYSISAANTWEYKTITIAGDTTGTWLTNNGIGIRLSFSLGAGATASGTAGSWGSTLLRSATGATSVVGTSGATFYITGVQLEVGTQATSFEYRQYTTEFQLCQRYFYSSLTGNQPYTPIGTGWEASSTTATAYCPFPVSMRAVPTSITFSSLQLNDSASGNPPVTNVVISTIESSPTMGNLQCTITGGAAGRVSALRAANSTSGFVAFSAEL
jgi:hypothetical protein